MEPGSGVRRTEGDAQKWREGGRERALHTEGSFILSDFSSPPLRSLLFSLRRNYCPFFQYISLSSLSSSGSFGMAARRHQRPPSPLQVGIHGSRDQQDSGRGKMRDEPLMRARPRHPGRNVCKWYAHSKRTLGRWGGRRPSSCWAQRKMSGSGQKNDNQTSPPLFFFFYFI